MLSTDGRQSSNFDSSGQSNIYIPPGDAWNESYRLSTYSQFPAHHSVSPSHLAGAGFYYSGCIDRVICFSCGIAVENWIAGDNPEDSKWHRSDCEFANGRDRNNIPLNRYFGQYRANRLQQSPLANYSSGVLPRSSSTSIVISGGNYTQQTITPNNLPAHTPSYGSNQDRTSGCQHAASRTISIPLNQGTEFTQYACDHPVNPHMRSRSTRLETFRSRNDIRWPQEKLRAGVEEIVDAGFFYLGVRDRVKCWYCNGGLQNWEYTDDPVIEHIKWFPSCEFMLRLKGADFVNSITSAYPNLNRPTPVGSRRSNEALSAGAIEPLPLDSNQVTESPATSNEAVEQAMTTLGYIGQVQQIGFNDEKIKQALKRKYDSSGRFQANVEEFLEDLMLEEEAQINTPNRQETQTRPGIDFETTPAPTDETAASMLNQLRQLEQSRLCKVCTSNVANMVLTPCGHLSSCENCSDVLRRCPVCRKSVEDAIKTFRA